MATTETPQAEIARLEREIADEEKSSFGSDETKLITLRAQLATARKRADTAASTTRAPSGVAGAPRAPLATGQAASAKRAAPARKPHAEPVPANETKAAAAARVERDRQRNAAADAFDDVARLEDEIADLEASSNPEPGRLQDLRTQLAAARALPETPQRKVARLELELAKLEDPAHRERRVKPMRDRLTAARAQLTPAPLADPAAEIERLERDIARQERPDHDELVSKQRELAAAVAAAYPDPNETPEFAVARLQTEIQRIEKMQVPDAMLLTSLRAQLDVANKAITDEAERKKTGL